jgi:hypothetical protein
MITGDERQELLQDRARVTDQWQRGVLERVELGDVDRDEAHALVLKRGLRCRGEVAEPRADDQHKIRVTREEVRRSRASGADAAKRQRMRVGERAFARLRFADGDAGCIHETPERVGRLAVDHAAAADEERPPARVNEARRFLQAVAIRARACDGPHARLEQRRRIVVRLGLNILRQRERHGAGLGG